jgi:hypothetical protein
MRSLPKPLESEFVVGDTDDVYSNISGAGLTTPHVLKPSTVHVKN